MIVTLTLKLSLPFSVSLLEGQIADPNLYIHKSLMEIERENLLAI